MADAIDTAANVAKFVGDAAKMALTIGDVALPIVQFVAPWIPGIGPVLADIQVALPIIKKIAQYAPAVQDEIVQGKPMIEAVVGIGQTVLMPLQELNVAFPKLAENDPFFRGVNAFLKANEFKPQDPRFNRGSEI